MKNFFRTVAILEALSFILLLAVAMPMKYWMGMPEATRAPGMIHGILFLVYLVLAHVLAEKENWGRSQLIHAYLASFLPLGTLIFDRKYMKHSQAREI
jgi:integral membrane protein